MCQLNNWCSNFTLQIGTKVIGFITLLGILLGVFHASILIQVFWNTEVVAVPALCIATNVLFVALTVSTISLLISAFQNEKPTRLVPWLIIHAISSVFSVCCLSYIGIEFLGIGVFMRVEAELVIFGLAYFVGAFIWGVLNIYYWLTVYYYFRELKTQENKAPVLLMYYSFVTPKGKTVL